MTADDHDATPLLEIDQLALAHRDGTVFGPVTATLPRSSLVVVHGPAGSGRSALLLALAGRMRGTTGTLRFTDAPNDPSSTVGLRRWWRERRAGRAHRRTAAIARVDGLVDLEPRLTVTETVTERCLADQVPVARGHIRFDALCERIRTSFPPQALVGELDALDRLVLTTVLAMLRPAALVVLDDLDRDLDTAGQAEMFTILQRFVVTGCTIVASTCDRQPIPDHVATISLTQGAP